MEGLVGIVNITPGVPKETDSLLRSQSDSNNSHTIFTIRPASVLVNAILVLVVAFIAFSTFYVVREAEISDRLADGTAPILSKSDQNEFGKLFQTRSHNDVRFPPIQYSNSEGESEAEVSAGGASPPLSKSRNSCNQGDYSKVTLKRAYEMPFAALFQDTRGQKKFEASDVIIADGKVYAVCDSLWSLSEFEISLVPFSPNNRQIGDPNRRTDGDSGYEALIYDQGNFYVVRESVLHHNVRKHNYRDAAQSYHAIVEELSINDIGIDYDVVETCRCEFEFQGDSKGFEGAIAVHDMQGSLTLLGLCEGNHCSEERKKDRGFGMVIVMQKVSDAIEGCIWKTIRKISLPRSVEFTDYSAIAIDQRGRIAVTSQEDSLLYVGKMLGKDPLTGFWDINSMEFDQDDVVIYNFPKNDNCEIVYCNIEGVHWLNDNMLIAVSDKMKSHGKQEFRCLDKDQSVHAFVLP